MSKRQRELSIRFDIDTIPGVEKGLFNLLKLARELNVRFTFFVNMGRTFDLKTALCGTRDDSGDSTGRGVRQTPVEHLGVEGILKTILFNPNLGVEYARQIRRVLDEGHELALHGGMNHPRWQHGLSAMTTAEIRRTLDRALAVFREYFGRRPRGFASPGFNSDWRVERILSEFDFTYHADSRRGSPRMSDSSPIAVVPCTLMGPAGVPIVEYLLSQQYNRSDLVRHVMSELGNKKYACLYGHPVCEGRHYVLLKDILQRAMEEGWLIRTHHEIVREFVE